MFRSIHSPTTVNKNIIFRKAASSAGITGGFPVFDKKHAEDLIAKLNKNHPHVTIYTVAEVNKKLKSLRTEFYHNPLRLKPKINQTSDLLAGPPIPPNNLMAFDVQQELLPDSGEPQRQVRTETPRSSPVIINIEEPNLIDILRRTDQHRMEIGVNTVPASNIVGEINAEQNYLSMTMVRFLIEWASSVSILGQMGRYIFLVAAIWELIFSFNAANPTW